MKKLFIATLNLLRVKERTLNIFLIKKYINC
jgi:hypothetical protein